MHFNGFEYEENKNKAARSQSHFETLVMCDPKTLNTLGLAFGMLGVFLIFVWGPPQPNFDEGVGIGLEDNNILTDGRTVAEHAEAARKLRVKHDKVSKGGLLLLFIGFALQLWATWA